MYRFVIVNNSIKIYLIGCQLIDFRILEFTCGKIDLWEVFFRQTKNILKAIVGNFFKPMVIRSTRFLIEIGYLRSLCGEQNPAIHGF